ncbi:MAG: NIPSNAP family protein [Gammaproteobacteria bacterium]|nr:NIPSNAP family protein [Gammaproteobacteria bacterium]
MVALAFNLVSPGSTTSLAQNSGKVFELRIYTATPGNLANLHARFRDHTLRIFEKHGMTNVGYWSPTDPDRAENTLIYLLAHDNREAADASWRAFSEDPEWQAVAEASNANGSILAGVERTWLTATDFSPMK